MTEQTEPTAPASTAPAPAAAPAATAAPPGRDPADTMAAIGGSPWWWIAYGVLTVLAGVFAVAAPAATALFLAILFGVQLFVLGIFRIVAAFAVPDTSTGTKVFGVLIGILSIIAGVLCLRSPVGTVIFLAIVVGAFWLVNGVMEVVAGIAGRGEPGRAWLIVGGIVGAIAGIFVLSTPVIGAVTLAWVLGIMLIVHGAVAIAAGFAARRAAAT